jgi:DNA-binding NarL/FixJ family response regulator
MVEQPRRVRLLLADEQALFREAMRVVLESEGDLKVVAEARDGVQAVMEAERAAPDVALLDADLPRCDGVRAAGLIRERVPACGVVIVSSVDSSHLLEQALDVGARGFVTKSSPLSDLLSVTRAVDRGETLIPPGMLGDLVGRWTQRRREQYEAVWLLSKLTKREREVLGLLIEGAGTEAIARSLVISPQTARTHVQNILSKLGVHSRLEAAALFNDSGVLEGLRHGSPTWARTLSPLSG